MPLFRGVWLPGNFLSFRAGNLLMSAIDTNTKRPPKGQPSQLGAAIRQRRKAMGKTLVQVAGETQLTTGFISQVERGISSPSLSSLMAIAAALSTSVEQLLSVPDTLREYTPADARQSYALGTNGRFYEKLGPGFSGALMYPTIIHRPPGHESEKMCHPGEVFFHLMVGQIEYHLDGTVFVMNPGDSLHHDTNKPHFSRVLGDQETTEMWVSTTPMGPN